MATGRNPGIRVPAPGEAHPGVILAIQQIIKEFGWQSSPIFASVGLSGMSIAGFVKNTAAGVLSGGNTIAVSDLPAHVLVGEQHTASGLTAGHVLQAVTPTTFGFAEVPGLHDAVTLGATADVLLGLTGQGLSLDTQTAACVLAGPATGVPAAPTFRALAATDIPVLAYDATGTAAGLVGTHESTYSHALLHARSHAITSTSDHTSTATPSRILKADASGLPVDATNTDAEVAAAVTKSHLAVSVTDTSTVNLTISGSQVLSAAVIAAGISHNGLSGIGSDDHHNAVTVAGAPLTLATQAITFNYDTGDFQLSGNNLQIKDSGVSHDSTTGVHQDVNTTASPTFVSPTVGAMLVTDADCAHGMTDLETTTTAGRMAVATALDGGLFFRGLSDTDQTPFFFEGVIGTASPLNTTPAMRFQGMKKSGTTYQALAATDLLIEFSTGGSPVFDMMATGGITTIFKLGDVTLAHGLTTLTDTSTYMNIAEAINHSGGAYWRCVNSTGAYSPLYLEAVFGVTDPTDNVPAMQLRGAKSDGGTSFAVMAATETVAQFQNLTTPLMTLLGNGNTGFGIVTPAEDVHAADTVRADVAFNLNGTDGATQAASAGTVCDVTASAGGIITAQTQITYATNGSYSFYNDGTPGNVTSITITNGRITAITVGP